MRTIISTRPFKRLTGGPTITQRNHAHQIINEGSDSDAPLCRGQSAQPPLGITQENEIQIFVHIDGNQRPITVSPHSTIRAAKEQLRNKDRWTYAGKVMHDDQQIHHYKITDGSTIFTSPDLKGGGGNDTTNAKIKRTLRDVLNDDGDKFDPALDA